MKKNLNTAALMRWVLAVSMVLCLGSCRAPKNVTYFQNLQNGEQIDLASARDIALLPGDRVSIVVVAKDPQLAMMFNLPDVSPRINSKSGSTGTQSNEINTYVLDNYGDIQFPVIGTLHLAGMRRAEAAEFIQKQLVDRQLLKDPVVIVDFLDCGVTVLGEVAKPTRVSLSRDRFTLLDALAAAGDLTIQGRRTDVLVLRKEDGREVAYRVDLTNAQQTLQSPVYYMQQDDVIYVSPNDIRKRQTTANGSSPFTPSFWVSIVSLLTTLAVLIWK